MNAFVKTTKGNFPNQNFYLAWRGFDEMKYDVIKFEEEQLDDVEFLSHIMIDTPVFAGVTVFDRVLKLKGINYKKIDTYPQILYPFMYRTVEKSTIGEFRKIWDKDEYNRPRLFMKPVEQKKFNGSVMTSILDWIPLTNLPDSTEVYLTEEMEFISEFRVYIQDHEILTAKHYCGDWTKVIDIDVVKETIKTFTPEAPCAYALDFGMTDTGKTALIEFNDATCLGNYGLETMGWIQYIMPKCWHQDGWRFVMDKITHHMEGPHFQFIEEENGEMFCHDMCDCGCVDKKWKINEGDIIIAFRPLLVGKLKNLTIHALEFKMGTEKTNVTLIKCKLFARDLEKYPLYSL